jgi:hypothetical protein
MDQGKQTAGNTSKYLKKAGIRQRSAGREKTSDHARHGSMLRDSSYFENRFPVPRIKTLTLNHSLFGKISDHSLFKKSDELRPNKHKIFPMSFGTWKVLLLE